MSMIDWKKFDCKAKTHWWRGTHEGRVFFIEKNKEHFFQVTEQGVERHGTSFDWHNTLNEAKAWADAQLN